METTYYKLNARKVKVSGGADMTTFVPVAVPAPAPRRQETEVLDFDRYRQRLETKAAWQDLAGGQAQSAPAVQRRQRSHLSREQRRQNTLETLATLCVLVVSLVAAAAFIALI